MHTVQPFGSARAQSPALRLFGRGAALLLLTTLLATAPGCALLNQLLADGGGGGAAKLIPPTVQTTPLQAAPASPWRIRRVAS